MTSILNQLRDMTTVVADTGDIEAVARLKPVDCTTNPSIVLKALGTDQFADTLEEAITWGGSQSGDVAGAVADRLAIAVGHELTKLVPGRVSTEVDADLSFDTAASVEKGRQIIAAYKALGVEKEQILIKLASTWEGIRACEILQKEGIDCNLTLMFSKAQAIACADAGAFLISPFVGRINDIKTVVMGASFRNTGEIMALAGCDRLTISPALMDEMDADNGTLERKLIPDSFTPEPKVIMDEATFRWQMNEDAMATEKTAEGIRAFAKDLQTLRTMISEKLEKAA